MARLDPAPLYSDVADAPPGGRAWFVRAADGVRIRAAHWRGNGRGTVLLFPGRTEYIEKYGLVIGDIVSDGYDVLCIDWRGQGLSDRLAGDPMIGHVGRFAEYQHDVGALATLAEDIGAPAPRFLLSHSMGGAIALRSLVEGLPVAAAVFSAPMFALSVRLLIRGAFWATGPVVGRTPMRQWRAPGTFPTPAVLSQPFDDNDLTTDRPMWDRMVRQLRVHPDLGLAGPSIGWAYEALVETRRLRRLDPPATPAIFFRGTRERIVDPRAIEAVARKWPGARLIEVPGSEHEVLMDRPENRRLVTQETLEFLAGISGDADEPAGRAILGST